jgi:hypothetical protein
MPGKRSTVYSGQAITFSVATISIANGLGKDVFLEIEQEGDDFSYVQGLDGEGVHNLIASGPTNLKVTLLQTAAGNGILSGLHIASRAAGGLTYPIAWEDRKGTSKGVSVAGVIKKFPAEKFGKEADEYVWEFILHDPERFVGGH